MRSGALPDLDEVCEPSDERLRLAGAGTGDDQQGSATMADGALLGVVERELRHRSREHAFDPSARRDASGGSGPERPPAERESRHYVESSTGLAVAPGFVVAIMSASALTTTTMPATCTGTRVWSISNHASRVDPAGTKRLSTDGTMSGT